MTRRWAAKRDAVERQIVEALRLTGWTVEYLSLTGGPDLLIGKAGVNHLAEVKSGKQPLKPGQREWHAQWKGARVFVLRDVEDVNVLNAVADADLRASRQEEGR